MIQSVGDGRHHHYIPLHAHVPCTRVRENTMRGAGFQVSFLGNESSCSAPSVHFAGHFHGPHEYVLLQVRLRELIGTPMSLLSVSGER